VLVDPFAGCLVHERELPQLLARVVSPGRAMRPEYLSPLDVRQFAQRMLLNLKLLYHARQEHGRAFLVTERLLELAPSPELRRDRGLYALQLGAYRAAAADLAHYLLKRPAARDAQTVRSALSKSRKDIPHAN
jgi:regulator of sirC expression with transglutaminase-like and TPR domain